MSDEITLLHAGLATPRGKKPSVQYRTSPYTVEQYSALPYAQRRAVDADCDARAGLTYTTYDDESSEKPYTVGRRETTSASPSAGIETAYQSTTSQPSSLTLAMFSFDAPTAPLAAQHGPDIKEPTNPSLDYSEEISQPTAEPTPASDDTEPAAVPFYDMIAVVSHYLLLTPTADSEHWTHCGPSPYVRGDAHSFAVNGKTGFYQCYATGQTGFVLDFVMFMEECGVEEALAWLDTNYPPDTDTRTAEVVHENGPLSAPQPAPESVSEIEATPDGPACDYPGGFGLAATITTMHRPTPDPSPEGEGSVSDDFAALAEAVNMVPTSVADDGTGPRAIDGTVYSTTNYDLFHLLPENRHIDPRQVAKLVREIKVKNMLHIKPIDVTADMGIIDGQHRREAARELGVPIYYRIGEKLSGSDIRSLNVASKNWVGTDYLHHWTVLGKSNYQALTAFMERYPILSFSNAVLLLQDSDKMLAPEFRDGLWTASLDAATAIEMAEFIQRIAADVPTFKQSKSSRFISSVLYCIKSVEGFSSERFLKKILLAPMKLVPCGNRKQYLLLFSDIYNFGATKEQRITFS